MITIGIDPGIEKCGVAIVEENKGKLKLINSQLIKTSSNLKESERLEEIFIGINNIISEFIIDYAAIEKLYFSKNVKTAMSISQAKGVILLALQLKKIKVFEYTPLEVKKALIGYGRGKKRQIQSLVKIILNLENIPQSDDVADAMAIAITHINTHKFMSKVN